MGNATAFSAAAGALADIFTDILLEGAGSFAGFEDEAIRAGHSAMARAMGLALERYDGALCLGAGLRAHDARRRTLATEVGDVSFSWRRMRDASGATVVPLADALDLPWAAGSRLAPRRSLWRPAPRSPTPPRPACSPARAGRA